MSQLTIRLVILTLAVLVISIALELHSGPPEVRKWAIQDPDLPEMKVAVFADFHFSEPKDLELLATLKRRLIVES